MTDAHIESNLTDSTNQLVLSSTLRLFHDYAYKLTMENAIDRHEIHHNRPAKTINAYYKYTELGLSIPDKIKYAGGLALFIHAQLYYSSPAELALNIGIINSDNLEDLSDNNSVRAVTKIRFNGGRAINIPNYDLAELDLKVSRGLMMAAYTNKAD
jgi:hypothetical protein